MERIETHDDRRRAMGALACMPAPLLAERYETLAAAAPAALPVRGPDIGLVMLRGRAGGGGAAFNLGEASVVRATVRLSSGEVGHAVVLGRDTAHARMAAHLDALWQCPVWRDRVEDEVVRPGLAAAEAESRRRAEETEATRVDFFTLVRGED
jgi:alpha-D-ribose 1-methylphosphonate 5-triphosphate synthase subunit PhnG